MTPVMDCGADAVRRPVRAAGDEDSMGGCRARFLCEAWFGFTGTSSAAVSVVVVQPYKSDADAHCVCTLMKSNLTLCVSVVAFPFLPYKISQMKC